MGRDENATPSAQPLFLFVIAAGLMFTGIIGCFGAGFIVFAWAVDRDRTKVGDTAAVVADPRSEYTVGNGARAAGTHAHFAYARDRARAGDWGTIEAMEKRGSVVTLAEGEVVEIVADELQFEEVYEVRVVTGPHAGKNLFVSWASVRRISKHK